MQTAVVKGTVVATARHASMRGARLLIVQPVDAITGSDVGFAQIAVDVLGAGIGQKVLLSSDGKAARDMLKADKTCPARLVVTALIDPLPKG